VNVEQFVISFVIPLEEYPHIQGDQPIANEIEKILQTKGW
jgi:hypothetical protein